MRFALKFALGAVIAVGIGFGSLYGVFRFQQWRASTKPGTAYGSVFVGTAARDKFKLVLLDDPDVSTGGGKSGAYRFTIRLTNIDTATGLSLGASENYENLTRCWGAQAPDRLWCEWKGGAIGLLDAKTLKIITDVGDAAKKLGTPIGNDIILKDGGVANKLSDGRYARVDPAAGSASVVDERTIASRGEGPRGTECATVDHFGRYKLSSGSRAAVITRDVNEDAEPPADAARFLEATFLWVSDPTLVLVLHRPDLANPQRQLSRIGDDGKVMWTADIGECGQAHLEDRLLVMSTKDPAARAVAVYIGTGGVAWTYGRD